MSVIQSKIDEKGVLTITLNKPEIHNAFDDQMLAELTDSLIRNKSNEKIRILVIRSNGKSFCAGADLNWMKSMKDYSFEENVEDSKKLANFFDELNSFPTPTISVMQGHAFGGALGILGASDFVIAVKTAKLCFSEAKLGLIPAVISPFVISKLGAARLRELFLSAKLFNAEEAYRFGLVSDLVDSPDQLEQRLTSLIEQILALGPTAVKKSKELIFHIDSKSTKECLEYTTKLIANQRISSEGQEGMSALLEKRTPSF